MQKTNQKQDVLNYIKKYGSITQDDAVKIGCYRLAARIADIKKDGITILTEMETVVKTNGKKTRVARYKVVEG